MRSVTIVAVGDDEQSIYSWRMAAPEGIRRFTSEYQDAVTRTLTLSRRVRANFRANWTRQIRQSLEDLEIPVRDIEAAIEPLNDPAARQTMATCRLLLDERDDLAWWTFLQLRRNCSGDYIRLVADSAFVRGIRFHERLKVMNEDPVDGTSMSRNAVLRAIVDIEQTIVQFAEVVDYATPTSIVHEIANHLGLDLGNGFLDLLDSVVTQLQDEMGKVTLMDVISRLEPSAKDLALTGEGIAFMRIDKSKGLTFDVTITMGVEEEVFSSDKPNEHEELRRLLYVAMTRARRACYLTMARNRAGDATAYSWPCAETWVGWGEILGMGVRPRWNR